MSDPWNSWDLKPPPVCTVKRVLCLKEINWLKEVLFDVLNTLGNADYLHKEAAIISRFLYKNKRIFRHDKGLQNLAQVNQCLKRYLKLNLWEVVNTLKRGLPGKLYKEATHAYLPTRQMLKWVLLRLQAFSQIFVRLIKIGKQAGIFIYGKIHLGWSLHLSLLTLSATARIFASSKFLVAKSIEWYNSLYKCLPFLEETAEFLPAYKFPVDLKKWLGDVDLSPLKKKTSIDKVFELIDLVNADAEGGDDDDDEVKVLNGNLLGSLFKERVTETDSDEEIQVIESEEVVQGKGIKRPSAASSAEDFGVPVEQEVVEIPPWKKSRKKIKSRLHQRH